MKSMLEGVRRLAVGFVAIAAAAAVLLFADLDSRRSTASSAGGGASTPRIALVQHATLEPLDDGMTGIIDALAQRGFREGKGIEFVRYNAQGDVATSNTIAKQVSSSNVDLVVTVSTISLQTVANANRFQTSPKRHVFGITTDPFAAGVGISATDPLDHPPYMAGLGSVPPVRELFGLAKEIHPEVRRIGLVWNPAEANSEAATLLARAAAKDLGLILVEGNAESSTAAGEVARSVLARGVDVLLISTDVTVSTAMDVLIGAARREGVPVIGSLPAAAAHGALLGFGSSYYDVGAVQGNLAADILQGRDPATIPVLNWTPVILHLNLTALKGLRDPWIVPDSIRRRARVVIDESGTSSQDVPIPSPPEILQWKRGTTGRAGVQPEARR